MSTPESSPPEAPGSPESAATTDGRTSTGKKDHFPQTQQTWVGDRIHEGPQGRADLNRHIMQVYADPLRIYFLGSSVRNIGEPEDIVGGFFSDRLDREDFFSDWQQSGKRLRHWLINAFHFYLKEELRRRKRDKRIGHLPQEFDVTHGGPSPEQEVDRAFRDSIVQTALATARAECEAKGYAANWQVFERHHCQQERYADFVGEMGIDETQAAVMVRIARRAFIRALREQLQRDGTSAEKIDAEIRELMDA
ncbi:MAG: hypothetical protein AAF581_14345 [Planctomycetota bacterium]